MLDVRRMRVLKEVAAQRSFSAAAEKLGYTQPAVSQQIAALARDAGSILIERHPRGIRLTDAGEALVRHADKFLARLAEAEAELEAIAGLRGGRLRLASFPTAGATLVPRAIAEFSERHPAVSLTLAEAEPDESLPRLKAGELDLILVDAARSDEAADVVIRSIGSKPPVRQITAATLANGYRSPAVVEMLEVLKAIAADYDASARTPKLAAAS